MATIIFWAVLASAVVAYNSDAGVSANAMHRVPGYLEGESVS